MCFIAFQLVSLVLTSFFSAVAAPSTAALTGYDVLMWDYAVTWPLTLVISRKALTKYQMIFRHIFICARVQRQVRFNPTCDTKSNLFRSCAPRGCR